MTTASPAPRHRKARRPMAPIESLTDTITSLNISPVRGTAVASVTGLALTAAVTSAAGAAPVATATTVAATTTTTAKAVVASTTVSVPDIAWDDDAEVAASAEAPAVETPAVTEAASRDEARADLASSATAAERATAANVAANASGGSIVSIAMSLLGVPYVYGGSSPAGFDCSGFTQYVYGLAGISIPRTSGAQGYAGTFVSAADAQPGDLVWHSYGHVGIYAGDGMVIEATVPGSVTKVQPLWGNYQFVRY